jgi:serine/threonine protein kinase
MVGEALGYLHNNFRLHRDVKPENVLFHNEDQQLVKLADFDMCCVCPEGKEFIIGSSVVGTPGYLAPEVLEMKRYSRQSDLFALGALMHFCATGEAPTEFVSARDVTNWCEMTGLELAEGFAMASIGKSPEFRQALGFLLKEDAASRPDRFEEFTQCAWLAGVVGEHPHRTKHKKNSLKKTSLKKENTEEGLIQQLLTIKVDMDDPQYTAVARAA